MNPDFIAPAFGAVLAIFGIAQLRAITRTWQAQRDDGDIDDPDRQHYYGRYRRRMQTSALIVLLGILLACEPLIPPNAPRFFAVYCITLLLLAGWLIVMALGDLLSTGAHTRAALARVRQKQRELERAIDEYRTRQSNGRHSEE